MYPNLQTEKINWSNFAKDNCKKRFVQTLMAYIYLNIEFGISKKIEKKISKIFKKKRRNWRHLTSKFQSKVIHCNSRYI